MNYYFYILKKYWLSKILTQSIGDVDGRASRTEFWTFTLINYFILGVFFILYKFFPIFLIFIPVYIFVTILPTFTMIVRRLQDANNNGLYALLGIFPLLGYPLLLGLACAKGSKGSNRFGADPLESHANYTPPMHFSPNFQAIFTKPYMIILCLIASPLILFLIVCLVIGTYCILIYYALWFSSLIEPFIQWWVR